MRSRDWLVRTVRALAEDIGNAQAAGLLDPDDDAAKLAKLVEELYRDHDVFADGGRGR
jgi:hypothetical protein